MILRSSIRFTGDLSAWHNRFSFNLFFFFFLLSFLFERILYFLDYIWAGTFFFLILIFWFVSYLFGFRYIGKQSLLNIDEKEVLAIVEELQSSLQDIKTSSLKKPHSRNHLRPVFFFLSDYSEVSVDVQLSVIFLQFL